MTISRSQPGLREWLSRRVEQLERSAIGLRQQLTDTDAELADLHATLRTLDRVPRDLWPESGRAEEVVKSSIPRSEETNVASRDSTHWVAISRTDAVVAALRLHGRRMHLKELSDFLMEQGRSGDTPRLVSSALSHVKDKQDGPVRMTPGTRGWWEYVPPASEAPTSDDDVRRTWTVETQNSNGAAAAHVPAETPDS